MKTKVPSYRLHRATGQAVVTINGRDVYLGKYGSEQSRIAYGEALASRQTGVTVSPGNVSTMTVNELCLAFLTHADEYYVKNGKRTSEVDCFKLAIRPMIDLYGGTAIADFGPNCLRAVRAKMIENGNLCRSSINDAIGRIRHVVKWGASHEMFPVTVLQALQAVEPLKRGRCEARETAARKPVHADHIAAVKNIVCERTADLIDLQLMTAARSGELLSLTTEVIDRSGTIWYARLGDHKTIHHGVERVIVFLPQAQMILRKYLLADPSKRIFAVRRDTYGKSIKAACEKLGIPVWTPHFLRHNAATRLRENHGLDAAQLMLGHRSAKMTELYAHMTFERLMAVAEKIG